MKRLGTLCAASVISLAMIGFTKPADTTTADPAPVSGEPTPASTGSMPEPAGSGGMMNTLNVTYECDQGGDLNVRYAGVSDMSSSTASMSLKGVELKLPRKGDVWDDGTYMLKGDDEVNLSKADVFVYQHVVEKVNGVDTPSDKIVMKDCRAMNATP